MTGYQPIDLMTSERRGERRLKVESAHLSGGQHVTIKESFKARASFIEDLTA